jgi:hypothetical protein
MDHHSKIVAPSSWKNELVTRLEIKLMFHLLDFGDFGANKMFLTYVIMSQQGFVSFMHRDYMYQYWKFESYTIYHLKHISFLIAY